MPSNDLHASSQCDQSGARALLGRRLRKSCGVWRPRGRDGRAGGGGSRGRVAGGGGRCDGSGIGRRHTKFDGPMLYRRHPYAFTDAHINPLPTPSTHTHTHTHTHHTRAALLYATHTRTWTLLPTAKGRESAGESACEHMCSGAARARGHERQMLTTSGNAWAGSWASLVRTDTPQQRERTATGCQSRGTCSGDARR